MWFLDIFTSISSIMMLGANISPTTNNVDKTKSVVYFTKDPAYDTLCRQNSTKGIYNPQRPGSIEGSYKCCKGKLLVDSFWVFTKPGEINVEEENLPEFAFCDYKITVENANDDLATLMWKIHACKIKAVLRKDEKDVNFQAYVDARTVNYTMENNVQKLVRDGNNGSKCPDANLKNKFHEKIAAYFWCFQKNEEKICQETTPESEKTLQTKLKAMAKWNSRHKSNCPGIPAGTNHVSHCCNATPIPYSWTKFCRNQIQLRVPTTRLQNGSHIVKKSYSDCISSTNNLQFKFTARTGGTYSEYPSTLQDICHIACVLNPVKFLDDGTSEPKQIHLDYNEAMDKYLSSFNTAAKKVFGKITLYEKNATRISLNNGEIFASLNDTGATFKKLTNPRDKAKLYCYFYVAIESVVIWSFGIDTSAKQCPF